MDAQLDGKLVCIRGYLLPIEFPGKQVTEFLLAPWVGACIHTPLPPPNQIVHVKPEKSGGNGGHIRPGLGNRATHDRESQKKLSMIDGSTDTDIDIGYSLHAARNRSDGV